MTSDSDMELIERLRNENLEQFYTLVRMHLSFIVDINTDDVDSSTDKPKQFRWNFHRKTKNSSQSNSNSNVKSTTESSITEAGLLRLYELIDFLSKPDNVTQEGIFRRTGSLSRQQELRTLLLTGSSLGLEDGKFSVHDCASVLKGFLADLPQPLLMDQYYQTYCTLATQYPPSAEPSETKLLTALQLLLLLLTPSHRNFLDKLLRLLRLVADNEASNRMSPDTLATMFTPHLLCPRKLSPETFHSDSVALSPVVSLMIRQREVLSPPQQLLTDARNYLNNHRQALNESVSDMSAAKTVYTFVDRNRTRAENESNPTDAALAQLYAHIQALPDSQHKRKLIKHFNRQNGYGTPIQIQRTGKVAGSRSFGDSIKRHIFNKGLLNKTPKKGSATAINTIDEKSSKAKLRFSDDKVEISHKNIVMKNLASKIASSESAEEDYESDVSNESTLSEGAICKSRKRSPKFVSEPNLSILDGNKETPKNTKKQTRLFRSKIISASQNLNKKYQKRGSIIRGTPTSCVSCFDEQETISDSDVSLESEEVRKIENPIQETPKKQDVCKVKYLTSTPGISEVLDFDDCETPYTSNFRRASMSPISKSTQKLSKAMQESIMTPRSRKPLIITYEQRDSLLETNANKNDTIKSQVYRSISPKNDSDFVSSEDEMSKSSFSCDRSNLSNNASTSQGIQSKARSMSIDNISLVRHSMRSLSQEKTNQIEEDLNTTLCGSDDGLLIPKIRDSHEMREPTEKTKSLTEPFREYLLSRSVLTATPIDLSILNKSSDTEEKITDSLLYCLDGNIPSDLTSCINNLVVDKRDLSLQGRSPLKNLNGFSNEGSPSRKRSASTSMKEDSSVSDSKKALVNVDKDNVVGSSNILYEIRETEL